MKAPEDKIVKWLQKSVEETKTKGLVFGMSGGLDSSVVSILCKKAFSGSCLGLIMPCDNALCDEKDASEVAGKFNIPVKHVQLYGVLKSLYPMLAIRTIGGEYMMPPIVIGNMKARLRMIILYYFANSLNYLVVGTGNLSEITIGYFTKYGDGGVDLLPLGNITKTEVKEMAKRLEVPNRIIMKPPSAGLWAGQTDEEEIGVTYEELDQMLIQKQSNMPEEIKERIVSTKHKREQPKVFLE